MKAVLWCFVLCFAPASVSSVATQVNSSSKAGLAWGNGNAVDYKQYTTTGKVSWYYTWSPQPINADLEFVPMLWGQESVTAFQATINQTIGSNEVTAILGMNEPDQPGQSSLTPQQGIDMWMANIQPLKAQGLRLGTPAPSSAPAGKTWIQNWLSACAGGCTPDFVALHWYGTNATLFQLYLQDFRNTFQMPIWVTEWACEDFTNGPQCSYQDVVNFLNQTQSFMDATSWVERYAWFGIMENLGSVNSENAMMDTNGKITPLGEQYIGAPSGNGSVEVSASQSKATLALPRVVAMVAVVSSLWTAFS